MSIPALIPGEPYLNRPPTKHFENTRDTCHRLRQICSTLGSPAARQPGREFRLADDDELRRCENESTALGPSAYPYRVEVDDPGTVKARGIKTPISGEGGERYWIR